MARKMHPCNNAQVNDKPKIIGKPESIAVNNKFLSVVLS